MKLRLTLPNKESKYLGHDSPLIKAVGIGILAFILLSSSTVFVGVKSHISEYMDGLPVWIAYPVYTIGYLVFSLAPDALNVVCIAFVARSILLGFYSDARSIVLIAVCLVCSFYLSRYSYQMSQVSATSLARSITPDEQPPDVVKFDSTLQNVVAGIGADFDKQYDRLAAEYDKKIESSNRAFEAKKAPYQRQIDYYNKVRTDDNTLWIDKQINRQQRAIEPIEANRAKAEADLMNERQKALDELRARRIDQEDRAAMVADTSKAIVIADATKKNSELSEVTETLVKQLSGIAGVSVFILLALAIVREILRARNDIKPVPVWSEFDQGGNPISEVLMFIPTKIGRSILRGARKGYEGIREKGMPLPEAPGALIDWTTANNEIAKFDAVEDEEETTATGPNPTATTTAKPKRKPRQKRKRTTAKNTATTTAKKSRPIGFNFPFSDNKTTSKMEAGESAINNGPVNSGNSDGKEKIVYREVDTSIRQCKNCGEDYKPRAHNQKFCGQKCKDQFHTNKHGGQKFNPGKYHGKK